MNAFRTSFCCRSLPPICASVGYPSAQSDIQATSSSSYTQVTATDSAEKIVLTSCSIFHKQQNSYVFYKEAFWPKAVSLHLFEGTFSPTKYHRINFGRWDI